MKTFNFLSGFFALGLLICACSSEETAQMKIVEGINAKLHEFKLDESMTRTAYNVSEQTGFETVWAKGDVLGIYPIGGDQVAFPISDGVGSTYAKFDGGSWALRGNFLYAAYYPFSTDFYTTDQTAIPVSFLGQIQYGNDNTSHLSAYDFMASAASQPSLDGSVDLNFEHLGCFLRLQLTMPEARTFTKLDIKSDNGNFSISGNVNLAATVPAISPTESSSKLSLGLNNVKTINANQIITLYMMVAPDNMSDKTLTFTVTANDGSKYSQKAEGRNMLANYAYNYSLTMEKCEEEPTTFSFYRNDELVPNGSTITITEYETVLDLGDVVFVEMPSDLKIKNNLDSEGSMIIKAVGIDNFASIMVSPGGNCIPWSNGSITSGRIKIAGKAEEDPLCHISGDFASPFSYKGSITISASNYFDDMDVSTITVVFDTSAEE